MKALVLLAILAQGCGLVRGPLRLLGVETGKIMVHKDQPPRDTLTEAQKEEWRQRFYEDRAECIRQGSQYATYSGSWGYSPQYGGGGGASTQVNAMVVESCLEARGYRHEGTGVSVFGKRLN